MIIFTKHALLKLKQRSIPQELVKKTLHSPDHTSGTHSYRKIAYKKFDKAYLKVIYVTEKKDILVITQHWERNPKFKK